MTHGQFLPSVPMRLSPFICCLRPGLEVTAAGFHAFLFFFPRAWIRVFNKRFAIRVAGLTGALRLEQIWLNKGGFYGTIKNRGSDALVDSGQ